MANSGWASVRDQTIADIEGIVPTVHAEIEWRNIPDARPEGARGRDREFVARRWEPVEGVGVFGGGEDQLARVLLVEVHYSRSDDIDDRQASDEQDIVAAVEPASTYTTGTWGSIKQRRVLRDKISPPDADSPNQLTIPIRIIWREPTSHV